jgi:putative transposase
MHGKLVIINSDQGSQFTCHEWIEYLESEEIRISMDGKGRAIDNIFFERLRRSVKYDYVYIKVPSDGLEPRTKVTKKENVLITRIT